MRSKYLRWSGMAAVAFIAYLLFGDMDMDMSFRIPPELARHVGPVFVGIVIALFLCFLALFWTDKRH